MSILAWLVPTARQFDIVERLFVDIEGHAPASTTLRDQQDNERLVLARAHWFDGDHRWAQVIAIPVERVRETMREWFQNCEAIGEDTETTVQIRFACDGVRPVLMTAVVIEGGDVDAARRAAEEAMIETLAIYMPMPPWPSLRVVR